MEREPWNFKEDELQRVWATIADGVLFLKVKAAQIRSPVLRYVHKALANTFFARKALGQSTREKSSSLTWESSPSSHAQAMGEIRGDRSAGNSCLSLTSSPPTRQPYNTRHKEEGSLVLEGHHTYLCAAGVHGQESY
ncbi:unnamed protein product [Microthlaspi erraticum]|uniref:Arabidopsis retrotransposon Orf1 C-terminal domain-containing protein n=1 Tax=Microthlaspi erraticum TaxID=1685480 RepID=A0A6D2J9T7_9BRAS|nr:unnamed protein product [Microthlaspi erraticum]